LDQKRHLRARCGGINVLNGKVEFLLGIVDSVRFYDHEDGYTVLNVESSHQGCSVIVGKLSNRPEPGNYLSAIGYWQPRQENKQESQLKSHHIAIIPHPDPHKLESLYASLMKLQPEGKGCSKESLWGSYCQLKQWGFPEGSALSLCLKYGEEAMCEIAANPYLTLLSHAADFKLIDNAGRQLGFPPISSHRIKAGVAWIKREEIRRELSLQKENAFIEKVIKLLKLPGFLISEHIEKEISIGAIIRRQIRGENHLMLDPSNDNETLIQTELEKFAQLPPTSVFIAEEFDGIIQSSNPTQHVAGHFSLSPKSPEKLSPKVIFLAGGDGENRNEIIESITKSLGAVGGSVAFLRSDNMPRDAKLLVWSGFHLYPADQLVEEISKVPKGSLLLIEGDVGPTPWEKNLPLTNFIGSGRFPVLWLKQQGASISRDLIPCALCFAPRPAWTDQPCWVCGGN